MILFSNSEAGRAIRGGRFLLVDLSMAGLLGIPALSSLRKMSDQGFGSEVRPPIPGGSPSAASRPLAAERVGRAGGLLGSR
jgi:hypothetical protein